MYQTSEGLLKTLFPMSVSTRFLQKLLSLYMKKGDLIGPHMHKGKMRPQAADPLVS